LEKELRTFPKLRKPWKALQKKWSGKEEAPKKDQKVVPEKQKKVVEEEPEQQEEEVRVISYFRRSRFFHMW